MRVHVRVHVHVHVYVHVLCARFLYIWVVATLVVRTDCIEARLR